MKVLVSDVDTIIWLVQLSDIDNSTHEDNFNIFNHLLNWNLNRSLRICVLRIVNPIILMEARHAKKKKK